MITISNSSHQVDTITAPVMPLANWAHSSYATHCFVQVAPAAHLTAVRVSLSEGIASANALNFRKSFASSRPLADGHSE